MKAERGSGRKAARRIVGLDFSGATAAGKAIWIAEGQEVRGQLAIDTCRPALELQGSGALRGTALPAVVRHLASLGDAIVGCDFPFGLPADMVRPLDWRGFLRDFPLRFRSAEAYRDACRAATGGREVKRACDREASTPFCVWNLRLYRQTWHGIAEILRPLALEHDARVLPMDGADDGHLWLAEVCPASFLKPRGLHQGYKGRSPGHRERRAAILDHLATERLLAVPAPHLNRVLLDNSGGDALDAVIAAVATWRNWKDGALAERPRTDIEKLEGRVYF